MEKKLLNMVGLFETSSKYPEFYTITAGNFDGAGLSFGVLQWNLGQGTLQELLKEISSEVLQECFGNLYPELINMLGKKRNEQIQWGNSISLPNKRKIKMEWAKSFEKLGLKKECQDIQVKLFSRKYLVNAKEMFNLCGLTTERGLALMVDIAVQNGSLGKAKNKILSGVNNFTDEVEKMIFIANERAIVCNKQWISDVRSRKLTIAKGEGIVHGIKIDMEKDFNITLKKVVE
jgi:hypothetical protein